MKTDPTITYLQCSFAANFRDQFLELHRRFPGESYSTSNGSPPRPTA